MNRVRLPIAFVCAVIVSGGLFWLMQGLIAASDNEPVAVDEPAILERIRIVEEPPPVLPPPPEQQLAPQKTTLRPQAATISIAPIDLPVASSALPELDLNVSVTGRLQSGGQLTGVASGDALIAFAQGEQGFVGDDLVPVSSARPRYPRSAAARKIEGWVELIFIINGNGRVSDIRVLDASPRGIFEDAAVAAMSRWLYNPYYVNGEKVAREATQLFRFKLEDIQDIYLWDDQAY